MPGKRCAVLALLVGALSLTGCCRWCERHCQNCHVPQTTSCTPAVCYPTGQAAYAPPPPVPATSWQVPAGQPMQCQCQCTPTR